MERPPDVHLDSLLQLACPSENKTEDNINPWIATSPENLYHSPESNTLDSDDPPASACPDPQPEVSGHEPVFILVNHEDDSIQHSPSDSSTILHHPGVSTEGAGMNNDLPLSHSRPSSDGPDEIRPSSDDPTATGEAPRSTSQPLPLPNAANPDSVVLQQAAMNGTSDSDGNKRQPGGRHLVVEVGSATSLEEVGAEIPGSGGDHSLDEAQPEDVAIRVGSPI